jgi:hypothetical protein
MFRAILRRRSRSRFALGVQPERAGDARRPVRTEPLPTIQVRFIRLNLGGIILYILLAADIRKARLRPPFHRFDCR